ncbi:fructose-bisphosphatase class II, partial [candidate division GN15 bacterium]|nr:fructose-bisphosphatase class II [candidate division GN15 bacterium]
MDRNISLDLIRVTETAALAAAKWMGKGDAVAADQAAVKGMHHALNELRLTANIAIGEGKSGEIAMLYHDEVVGDGDSPQYEIALDALECTKSVAFGRSNAMAVLAIAPIGDFFRPRSRYLQKLAVGPDAKHAIDLHLSVEENLARVADAKGYNVADLTVVVLDRERHSELIESIRKS